MIVVKPLSYEAPSRSHETGCSSLVCSWLPVNSKLANILACMYIVDSARREAEHGLAHVVWLLIIWCACRPLVSSKDGKPVMVPTAVCSSQGHCPPDVEYWAAQQVGS